VCLVDNRDDSSLFVLYNVDYSLDYSVGLFSIHIISMVMDKNVFPYIPKCAKKNENDRMIFIL